ncbi:MAG TPA: sugar ABC transporter substrate-binding protein [Fimbriimonadaceae bacterium]|nr:sugar ABC transporter substrate-binding protein [Fimbriimonadaceae bacterium]
MKLHFWLVAAVAVALSGCRPSSSTPTASAAKVDVLALKGTDHQPLILIDDTPTTIPPRPAQPDALPEEDPLHWYDIEYSGWNTKKLDMPKSPGNGPAGKRVLCLRFMDHPYLTAYSHGMQEIADAYGIKLETRVANNETSVQAEQVDQAISERPDLVIITPVDSKAVVPLLRKLHSAGIPVIASNLIPEEEGMKYVLTWTGPDDWGQFRMLAREFAKKLNYEGGYCVVRHMQGSSCFLSRTNGPISELAKVAPKMKCLDMQATQLQAEETMQVVSDWITRFGPQLKGIISADDSGAMNGIAQAIRKSGRKDIVVVAAGNSKVGMDFLKSGDLYAMTYQSAEADGALPMYLAAQWFSGKPIDKPTYFLPRKIITKANVDQFLPAQW